MSIPTAVLSPDYSILTGEAIYNLRSALDYLVYELAIADSGVVPRGTQFPIADSADGFRRRRSNYLKGLSEEHKDAIGAYSGADWAKILRDISNPDKHRALTVIEGDLEHQVRFSAHKPGTLEGRPGVIRNATADGSDLLVELDFAGRIALSDVRRYWKHCDLSSIMFGQ